MINRIFCDNKREATAYLFWGIAASGLNIGLYSVLVYAGIKYQLANLVTLVIVKLFCYLTNKLFVFRTKCKNIRELLMEFLKFFVARIVTFLMDYFGLILLVEKIGADKFASKFFLSAIIIIANYGMSKVFVFSKTTEENNNIYGKRHK